ncbi:transposase, partial [Kitasatospora sp. NPDC085895]|uniref:transposase n=1 Tax=Kitasatospora sp. NPDC085895 TaxID=3155057 RepID=UPI00344FA324
STRTTPPRSDRPTACGKHPAQRPDRNFDTLQAYRLPPYCPQLNPDEGVWAHLKKSLGNLAACTTDQLATQVRTRLKKMQYRPDLLDGFIAETGLTLAS